MDPLSVTLAVITLATALKDIIETAQVIQDSFSKLPQNYRNAQRLAQQLLDFLHGMEEIYREHEEILNKKESFKSAILNLQKEMESAHEQCARLIPPVAMRNSRTGRVKFAIYSFLNRKKVEQLLLELKDRVYGCTQHFQLINGIRTGAHVVEIRETLVQYTSHGSPGVHSHNSLASANMPHTGLGNVSNAHLFTFTQSTPIPMTWIANSIPAHDLSNAYLRREVGRVDLSLRSILTRCSQSSVDMKFSTSTRTDTISWDLEKLPMSRMVAHQDAVVHAIRFQSCLGGSLNNSWFRRVDRAINSLTIKLDDLAMYEDAITLGNLRVDMWRVILKQYPSRASSLGLVHALSVLSVHCSNMQNWSEAYSMREEAIKVLQSLVLEREDIMHMAILMLRQAIDAPYSGNKSLRVRLAADAGKMLEDTLGTTNLISETDVFSASHWDVISENNKISDDDWSTYAESLLHLAKLRLSSSFESRKLAKLTLAILNHLLDKYPGSRRVQSQLTRTLSYLSSFRMDTMDSQAIAENLKYIQQNVTTLRHLAPFNPQRYVLPLARALWSQREALITLGKSAEAENSYQDMLSLKDLAAAPLHSDLHIPSETEGDYYAQLAEYHYNVGRFSDAVYIAQNAISQYSALEFMDPGRSHAKHISTLTSLCKYLSAGCQYDAALSEGLKAIETLDRLDIRSSSSDLTIIESYREISCLMMTILGVSARPAPMAQREDINARLRKLAGSGKIKPDAKLGEATLEYVTLLQNNGVLTEVNSYLFDLLDKWEEIFGHLNDTALVDYLINVKDSNTNVDRKLQMRLRLRFPPRFSHQQTLFLAQHSKRLDIPASELYTQLATHGISEPEIQNI